MTDQQIVPLIEDPLAEALHFLRMDGMFYCRSELTAPWSATMPPLTDSVWFHVVTAGAVMLVDSTGHVHHLSEGDVAVLPHGVGHIITDTLNAPAPMVFDLPHEYISRQYAIMRHGGGGAPTTILCGVVQIGSPAARLLVKQLPEVITIDAATSGSDWLWFPSLMTMIANETRTTRPGGETVVTRLCDILVIQTIRAWIEREPTHHGWLAALRDPTIGRAITLIHRDPAHGWTVAELAAEVAMSRSGFATRFTELVGESPKSYLTSWRMQLGRSFLEDGLTIAEVATRLGYQSEAAFSRAFKRVTGVPPSHARHRQEPMNTGMSGANEFTGGL